MTDTCIVFGAGTLYDKDKHTVFPAGARIIAADGGRYHAVSCGLTPDIYVGDFDSSDAPKSGKILKHPCEKDETDLYLAMLCGYDEGCRTFHVYGAFGGERFDHSVASLQTLAAFTKMGARVFMYAKKQTVTMIGADTAIRFPGNEAGSYLSLFAFGGEVTGVTASGVKYPLENAALSPAFPLGVSNELCGVPALISCGSGLLAVIYERGTAAEFMKKE